MGISCNFSSQVRLIQVLAPVTLDLESGLIGGLERSPPIPHLPAAGLIPNMCFHCHLKGCGESLIDRIIGGETAAGKDVPWMCAIMR